MTLGVFGPQPPVGYSPGWSPVTSEQGAVAAAQGYSGIPQWEELRALECGLKLDRHVGFLDGFQGP